MELTLYQVDAFARQVFKGNPAAICPLDTWLPDRIMQAIAAENNLSETAFFVRENNGYHIRWFTPRYEVNLCGHATLAAAYVIFHLLKTESEKIHFESRSGELIVSLDENQIVMDFPAIAMQPAELPQHIIKALGNEPVAIWKAEDYLLLYDRQQDIVSLSPDFGGLKALDCRGIIITAVGEDCDFVSRFFAPRHGIDEDPVTGSAHCMLAPLWSEKLGKKRMTAKQLSKRGGELVCEVKGDRVIIAGEARLFLQGKIFID